MLRLAFLMVFLLFGDVFVAVPSILVRTTYSVLHFLISLSPGVGLSFFHS